MEEKCLENFDLIAINKIKQDSVEPPLDNNPKTTTIFGRDQSENQALHDILLNLPSTSRSSMSLLQEEDYAHSQHDFAEVLDEDTTTSGVLETFEISSSNSLPTCSEIAGDVAVVDDSSSGDAVKMIGISGPPLVSSCNNKFFDESEIYVINDDDDDDEDDDDDDDAVVVTDVIEGERCSDSIASISQMTTTTGTRIGESQLNGVIMASGTGTIYLETPVVEEQQHHHHHHQNNIINIVVAANGSGQTEYIEKAGLPKRLSDEFMLADGEALESAMLIHSNNVENVIDGQNKASLTDRNKKKHNTDMTVPVSDAVNGNANIALREDTTDSANINAITANANVNANTVVESGTVEGNAERMSFRLKNMSINNSASHDSTNSNVALGSVIDELPSGSNGLIALPTVADFDSMDLIERRDFETEQRLTGGIILKSNSLINKNLLNLKLIKESQQNQGSNLLQHSQQQQQLFKSQEDSTHNLVGRMFSSDSKCTYQEPNTTPTSSRNFNSRLTKSTAKLNMTFTLSQQNESDRLQPTTVSTSVTNAPKSIPASTLSSSSSSSSSSVSSFSNPNSLSSSSSSVIVEVPTTSQDSNSGSSNLNNNMSNNDRVTAASVSSNCQQREPLESGCSRTTALYTTVANTGSINGRAEDSEPSTSARCQYTPQSKAIGSNGVQRQVHHASAQTNDRYLTRNSLPATSSPSVPLGNGTGSNNNSNNAILGNVNFGLPPAGGLRNRRRLEATSSHLPRNSTSEEMIAAFKVVVAEAAAAAAAAERADFNEDEAWADCEENSSSDLEEICTCPHRSESESGHSSNEDDYDTPVNVSSTYKDVPEYSGYIQSSEEPSNVMISSNFTSSSGASIAQQQQQQRKRKYNEGRMLENECSASASGNGAAGSIGDNNANGEIHLPANDINSRKRIAYDLTSTPRSSFGHNSSILNTTPTSSHMALSPFGSPLGRRTPRSVIPTRENPPPELQNWLAQFQRWTHAERLHAVDRLIEHCEPTQVRHMMKVIEPQFQRDFISLLPRELALQVLAYLDPKDLLRAAQTCRSWRFLCDDNLLWKEKCRKAQILTEPLCNMPKRGRAGNMPPITSPWKAAYMRQHIIEMNWRSRPIREPKVLKGHDEHVITCLQFCGNRIVSGSDDNTLKVWSAVTGRCLRTLVGHTGGVWSSQMSGNIIISGSTDRTLKVWNMETGMCVHTLLGHTSTVRCMHLHGNKVVSGSRDATLRVWDIQQGTCLHVLVGHLAAVRCVQYDGKLIVSGAYDYMVKIWHPERQECLHTLQGHTNRVYSLQFDGVHVVSGSLDTSIRVWDVETGNCKHTLMGHQSLTSGMELRQNILVSGNADSTVKVWDITTGQCLQTLSGPNKHQSAVTCLQFNSRFVVTSSDDGTVKLWDVKTGEFIRNLVSLESGGSGGVVWRIRASDTKLICAVGSRNGTEETKLLVLDFDVEGACVKCS